MIYLYFYSLFLVLLGTVIFLLFKIKKLKKQHKIQIDLLVAILNKKSGKHNRHSDLENLSKQSENKLHASISIINGKILDLQKELITKLADKKLIE